jgi:hypothetical protein
MNCISKFLTTMNLTWMKSKCSLCRAFNIFHVYQYFTIYRWYFVLKFVNFRVYLIQYSLKSGGTKYHFRWVKVPGTNPY